LFFVVAWVNDDEVLLQENNAMIINRKKNGM
jgi:hypothetical protein